MNSTAPDRVSRIADHEEERVTGEKLDRWGRRGHQAGRHCHCGRSGGLGALLVDRDEGLVEHLDHDHFVLMTVECNPFAG